MKKGIAMALGLALLSSMALAQAPAAPAQAPAYPAGGLKPGQKVAPPAHLKNDLDLTDEQVKKMREIRDHGGSREEMQAVLTPEQRAKQAELRKQHRDDRQERKSQMQKQLGITDAQRKQMAEIHRKGGTREDMRAVLTPEQQAKFDARRHAHPGQSEKTDHSSTTGTSSAAGSGNTADTAGTATTATPAPATSTAPAPAAKPAE